MPPFQWGTCDCAGENVWIVDTGCSTHAVGTTGGLTNLERVGGGARTVTLASGKEVRVSAVGGVVIHVRCNGGAAVRIVLRGVLVVPGLKQRLTSASTTTSEGGCLHTDGDGCTLEVNGRATGARASGGLYTVQEEPEPVGATSRAAGDGATPTGVLTGATGDGPRVWWINEWCTSVVTCGECEWGC